jgi:OTU domain-containing protein 3
MDDPSASAQMEDSPEPPEAGEVDTLPNLKGDEHESTDADHGHHSDEDGPPGTQTSSRDSDSDADGDDDDDEDYVDDEEENKNEDEGDEDELEPNLNRVHSVVPPKVAKNHQAAGLGPGERPLTRRQRKKLGLPKSRSALAAPGKGAGKIVIPGGQSRASSVNPSTAEWTANGIGRVDVRGFRELKI